MMGSMNKHINSLSIRKLLRIEQEEHGLKELPTMQQAQANEMKEHNLKGVPSAAKVRRAEALEHGGVGRKKATEAYRAG
jgi:hypothetical protein